MKRALPNFSIAALALEPCVTGMSGTSWLHCVYTHQHMRSASILTQASDAVGRGQRGVRTVETTSAMSYPLLAQLFDVPYAHGCGCKSGLGSRPERTCDARYVQSRCEIALKLLWERATDDSNTMVCVA
jgi:hypothetical protein